MPVLREDERAAIRRIESAPWEARFDAQSWTRPLLEDALGADTEAVLRLMRERAPVFLRVNALKADVGTAREMLAEDGIETRRHDLSAFALLIIENPRRVAGSRAYREGLVELQDAASQAVVEVAGGLARDGDVLDYCAGGGGKALALAACKPRSLAAHDVDPRRMKDIPDRALRAGCEITVLSDPAGLYDLVFCDAPCSGSGAWRRQPEAKWTLTEDRLNDLTATQDRILERAAELVREGGCLAYATCSLFSQENEWRVERFLGARPDWTQVVERRFLPLEGGDGFFIAVLRRP